MSFKYGVRLLSKAILLIAIFISLSFTSLSFAAINITKIEFKGLSKINIASISPYVNTLKNAPLTQSSLKEAIRQLHSTNFFTYIETERRASTLIFTVKEHKTVSNIKISGNKVIKKESLDGILETLGIVKGSFFNPFAIDRLKQELTNAYHNQGHYAAQINTEYKTTASTVGIKIQITESMPATIAKISLIGNKSYEDSYILSLLSSKPGGKYSLPMLEADLNLLTLFYKDRGYLKFSIVSKKVSVSSNFQQIFISLIISEGDIYKFGDIDVLGDLLDSAEEFDKAIAMKQGEYFSQSNITKTQDTMEKILFSLGYSFGAIVPKYTVNEYSKLINVQFEVIPRNRVYVKLIKIKGNSISKLETVRSRILQLEGAPLDIALVKDSVARLQRSGLFKKVDYTFDKIDDQQVNIIFNLEEGMTGTYNAGISLSDTEGLGYQIGIKNLNLLGSGTSFNITANSTKARKNFDLSFFNPTYNYNGIGVGHRFFYSTLSAAALGLSSYNLDNAGYKLTVNIPIQNNWSLNTSLELSENYLQCGDEFIYCQNYIDANGDRFSQLIPSLALSYDSTNHYYFPTRGNYFSLSSNYYLFSNLPIYSVNISNDLYIPLNNFFTLKASASVAEIGTIKSKKEVPFYLNYTLGGIHSVRGYESNSLGEKFDPDTDGSSDTKGGKFKALYSAELISPVPLVKNSSNLRLSLFYDAGMVYNNSQDFDSDELRKSYGLQLKWLTVIGPIILSYAKTIDSKENDIVQSIQYRLGGF